MKMKGAVAIVLVALGSLGTGYWLGQHGRVTPASEYSIGSQGEHAAAASADVKPSPTQAKAPIASAEDRKSVV